MHKQSSNILSDNPSNESNQVDKLSDSNKEQYINKSDQSKNISGKKSNQKKSNSSKDRSKYSHRSGCSRSCSCSQHLDGLELLGEMVTIIKDSVRNYKNHNPNRFRPGMFELIEIGSQTIINGIGGIQLYEDIRDSIYEESDDEFKDEFVEKEKNDEIEERTKYKDLPPNKNDTEAIVLPPIPESFIENKEEDKHTSESESESGTDYSEELVFPNN